MVLKATKTNFFLFSCFTLLSLFQPISKFFPEILGTYSLDKFVMFPAPIVYSQNFFFANPKLQIYTDQNVVHDFDVNTEFKKLKLSSLFQFRGLYIFLTRPHILNEQYRKNVGENLLCNSFKKYLNDQGSSNIGKNDSTMSIGEVKIWKIRFYFAKAPDDKLAKYTYEWTCRQNKT